jgi:hypothetical protein
MKLTCFTISCFFICDVVVFVVSATAAIVIPVVVASRHDVDGWTHFASDHRYLVAIM